MLCVYERNKMIKEMKKMIVSKTSGIVVGSTRCTWTLKTLEAHALLKLRMTVI